MSKRRQGQIATCVDHYDTRYRGKNHVDVRPPGMRYCYTEARYLPVGRFSPNASRCRRCQRAYQNERKARIREGTWTPQKISGGDMRPKSD
jgi:hypothetical protein